MNLCHLFDFSHPKNHLGKYTPPYGKAWGDPILMDGTVNRSETYGTSSSSNISMNSFSGMFVILRIPYSNGMQFLVYQLNQAHTETENVAALGGETLWETIPLLLILNNNKMNLRLTIYNFKEKIIKGNLQQIYNIRKDHIFP